MGYSPRGHKESDTTKRLTHTIVANTFFKKPNIASERDI